MWVLVVLLIVVLAVYCLIELAQSDPADVRQLPRGLWALIVLIPLLGPVAWLVYGRPNGDTPGPKTPKARPRVVAPDDDPDFLRSLRQPRRPPDDTAA
ncbi:MAG: PLDc N-terminal domain-containing protein [Nocardioidaceae bacterium]